MAVGEAEQPRDGSGPATRSKRLETELEAAGFLQPDEIDDAIRRSESSERPQGYRVVARAWLDGAFKNRLLENANAAIAELGLSAAPSHQQALELRAVANTAHVHNLVVCTLCSCYPRTLLGPPPQWYTSDAYRANAVRDPAGVLGEFGLRLPADTQIHVWDSTAETRYLVIPQRPPGTDSWNEERLANLLTPEALVGTAQVQASTP